MVTTSTTYYGVPLPINKLGGSTTIAGYTVTAQEEKDSFKRLMVWRGLKIKSISVNFHEITIECIRNKKIFFIAIANSVMNIYNSKREIIDSISLPYHYETSTDSSIVWVDDTAKYPKGATTTTISTLTDGFFNTSDVSKLEDYKILFE